MREPALPCYSVERSYSPILDPLKTEQRVLVCMGTLAYCMSYIRTMPKKLRASHVILDPEGKPVEGINP